MYSVKPQKWHAFTRKVIANTVKVLFVFYNKVTLFNALTNINNELTICYSIY